MQQPSPNAGAAARIAEFGLPALTGVVIAATVAVTASDRLFGLAVGSALGLIVGLLLHLRERGTRSLAAFEELRIPLALASVPRLQRLHAQFGLGFVRIAARLDPAYRELATERLDRLSREVETLAAGVIPFQTTETWRVAYEGLLRSPGLYSYRSVAWVRTADYWQDEPGRKSLALNYELHDEGRLRVERIVILSDELWPVEDRFPCDELLRWIDEQHRHAIWICLVRESALVGEPDLPADFGIYGGRAVGSHELDEAARTLRFSLSFDPADVQAAEDRWRRLTVYATSYGKLLDQATPDA
ncbi:MAG: hypothetical protein M3552_20235 [Planctomycetota bacterium]|nr:hypothetical protein [Planctomycetota bacterium]